MIFKWEPNYSVSLSNWSMARYNASWEFHTEDKEVITLLKLIDEPVKEEKKEVKEEVKDIKALRVEYKKKFGKAPFGAWTYEEIEAKITS